ncbi:MAG: 16S rRNA (uracil(1498)-N(3))-methyltransferase [Verrucomicrobiales bacterium]
MHRFYVPPELLNDSPIELPEGEAHHARDVLRLQPGDRLLIFDGEGRELSATIDAVSRSAVSVSLGPKAQQEPLPCQITLAQAIPKGKKMDWIIEKATELGAARVVPLISDRTIVRLDAEEAASKQAKWQQTSIEAAKQCGQSHLPEISAPMSVKQFFVELPRQDLRLLASLQPAAQHLKEVLCELPVLPKSVTVMIGPEGDFTPAEMAMARAEGCVPLSLGPIILRSETAAIYTLSILAHELQHPRLAISTV